jgi:hypothetical protein
MTPIATSHATGVFFAATVALERFFAATIALERMV